VKILIALCAVSAMLASCSSASRIRYFDAKYLDTLASRPIDVDAYDKKYSAYDGVYLLSDRYYEHSGGSKLSNVRFSKVNTLSYVVLNPHADNLTTFSLDIEKNYGLEDLGVIVRAPDGTKQTFGRKDMRETRSESGALSYKLALPNIQRGSVVTTMYGVYSDDIGETLEGEASMQYSLPCERMEFHYAYPKWWSVRLKKTADTWENEVGGIPAFDNEHDKQIFSRVVSNVPGYRDDLYAPYFLEQAPYMKYLLLFTSGTEVYSGYSSWVDAVGSLAKYTSRSGNYWSYGIEDVTDTVVAHCTTKRQKLDSIIAYISNNIMWVGHADGDNARDIIEDKQGNAMTISALARAMMEDAGIDANLLIIHSADDGYFDQKFITPSELYTPSVYAHVDGVDYVMLPYYKGLTPGLLPDRLKGQDAMRVTRGGAIEFMTTPTGTPETNKRTDSYTIAINDEGTVNVEQNIELVGEMAYLKRRELEDLDLNELKTEMKEMLDYEDGDILNFEYDIAGRGEYGTPLTIKLRYSIDNLVTVTPDEVVFQTGGLFSPATRSKNKVDVEGRVDPIRVYGDETLEKKIAIHFPPSWKLSTPLPDVEKSNTFGEVKGTYNGSSGVLEVTHHRVLRRAKSGPDKFSDLLAIMGTRSVLNVPSLVFKRESHGN
jgi:hypothetical protein